MDFGAVLLASVGFWGFEVQLAFGFYVKI